MIAQLLGWAAMAAGLIRYQMKTARQIRVGNVISATLFGIHYALLVSWTASVLCFFGALRSAVLLHPIFWKQKKYVLLLSLIIPTILFYSTYNSWIDILPLLGLYSGAFMDIQKRAASARGIAVFGQTTWLTFNAILGSYGGIANNALNLSSNIIGFWRHQLYPYLKTKDKSHFKI